MRLTLPPSLTALPLLALAIVIGMAPERSTAVSELRLEIGDIDGGTWSAKAVVVRFAISPDSKTLAEITASRMTLPAGMGSLERVTVSCPDPIVREPEFSCRRARVTGTLAPLGAQDFTVDATYDSAKETLRFSLATLKIGSGQVRVAGQWMPNGWNATVDATPTPIALLLTLAKPWFALPQGFVADGRMTFHLEARGAEHVQALDLRAAIEELTANNAEGTLATDKLALTLDARLRLVGEEWHIEGSAGTAKGQGYSEPVFIDFGEHALDARFKARWLGANPMLALDAFEFEQQGVARGAIRGELDFAREPLLHALHVELAALEFPGAYTTLLQPFLLETDLKDLTTSGKVRGVAEIARGAPAAFDLTLDDVSMVDKAGKMALQGLRGRVAWASSELRKTKASDAPEAQSALQWSSAKLYGVAGGAARIRFVASGADFRVLEPTTLPILDGGLAINTLAVRNFGTPQLALRFDAELKPISMRLLSEAFGWPTFGGNIAGRIPNVTLEQRVLSFGGDLEAHIFDGRVVVNGLRLRDPLGTYPRLSANITMRNLDLEAVTGTFAVGSITGRLDADVRNLELFRWQPIGFDARLYTPRDDDSKHLISQRAVNNLSNIGGGGGGVAAALQGGVLRFFDNFRYSKLGLSCRLENETCHMDGVEPATGTSYYIVKGSGVPRIDIIGNAHRVNWNRLVGQLKAMQEAGGPVVK
jgi:hypothetical protein